MNKLTFKKHERIRRQEDFLRIRRFGKKKAGCFLVVQALDRQETPAHASRVGIVVSRKFGHAVKRNLFKRRVREIFRQNKNLLPRGWDFVVLPKHKAGEFPADYQSLYQDFLETTKKLCPL